MSVGERASECGERVSVGERDRVSVGESEWMRE